MSRPLGLLSKMDWPMFFSAFLLSALGLAAIASVGFAQEPPSFNGLIKQIVSLAAGLLGFLVMSSVNFRILENYGRAVYLGALALLLIVLVFGTTLHGTRGWFTAIGWGFQPVEFVKIALIILLARLMSKHADLRDKKLFFSSAFLVAAPAALVLLQPDFGGAAILVGLWVILLLLSGAKRSHLALLVFGAIAILLFAWFFLLKDYQKDRLYTFVNPSRAPLSRGWNSLQAKIAIGAGGLYGRGLGFGSQSQLRFIPEAQSDFIFAVIGEELGFLGVAAVLVLFFIFFRRAARLAALCRDNFTLFLTLGLMANFALSATVNIGMNLGVAPVAGIALPFLSLGGSSLVASWLAVGILQSIAVRAERARPEMLTEGDAGATITL